MVANDRDMSKYEVDSKFNLFEVLKNLENYVTYTSKIRSDVNVLALVKGSERYVFLYDDEDRAETLRVLGRYASNPDLSFTWYDAAILSQKIRQESRKQIASGRFYIGLGGNEDEFL